jgi:hypothetical protein
LCTRRMLLDAQKLYVTLCIYILAACLIN